MKSVQICRAEPGGAEVVEVIIEISCSLLNGDTELTEKSPYADHMAVFQREAKQIEEALYNALPGGTYDQLVGLLLQRKASHFVVRHADYKEK